MGSATIAGGGPQGRYTIALNFGEGRRLALVAAAAQNVARVQGWLNEALTDLEFAQVEAEMDREDLEAAQEAYIQALQAHGPTDMRTGQALLELERLTTVYSQSAAKVFSYERQVNAYKLTLAGAQARLTQWQNLQVSQTRQAWCADYTENASGAVATIEIPGESDLILIKPGAPRPTAADGFLLARELMSPEQAFFNAAMLAGWQTYKPTFRRGTLSAINRQAHTGTVTLAPANSSAQGLGVNLLGTLPNVPITYMQCNSDAFEVGDQVVVMFEGQSWQSPRVIGFVNGPKRCPPAFPNVFVQVRAVRTPATVTGVTPHIIYTKFINEVEYIADPFSIYSWFPDEWPFNITASDGTASVFVDPPQFTPGFALPPQGATIQSSFVGAAYAQTGLSAGGRGTSSPDFIVGMTDNPAIINPTQASIRVYKVRRPWEMLTLPSRIRFEEDGSMVPYGYVEGVYFTLKPRGEMFGPNQEIIEDSGTLYLTDYLASLSALPEITVSIGEREKQYEVLTSRLIAGEATDITYQIEFRPVPDED